MPKFWTPFFSGQPLLLSTIVLNDIYNEMYANTSTNHLSNWKMTKYTHHLYITEVRTKSLVENE